MIFKALIVAASMLSMGHAAPEFHTAKTVELQVMEAPALTQKASISSSILTELIEVHATEAYNLTIEESWQAYNRDELKFVELVANKRYSMEYDGILEIAIIDSEI